MFNRNDRCHSVPDVRSGKVCILLLKNPQLAGVLIHYRSKGCLKSGQMGAALCIIDIVAEPQYVFVELVDILKYSFHFNSLRFPAEINRIVERFLFTVQIPDKSDNSIRFMIDNHLRRLLSPVLKSDRQLRIQIGRLMKSALYFFGPEAGFLKNLVVRQEIHRRTGLFCLPDPGKKSILQFDNRNSSLIPVMVNVSVPADLYIHIRR